MFNRWTGVVKSISENNIDAKQSKKWNIMEIINTMWMSTPALVICDVDYDKVEFLQKMKYISAKLRKHV